MDPDLPRKSSRLKNKPVKSYDETKRRKKKSSKKDIPRLEEESGQSSTNSSIASEIQAQDSDPIEVHPQLSRESSLSVLHQSPSGLDTSTTTPEGLVGEVSTPVEQLTGLGEAAATPERRAEVSSTPEILRVVPVQTPTNEPSLQTEELQYEVNRFEIGQEILLNECSRLIEIQNELNDKIEKSTQQQFTPQNKAQTDFLERQKREVQILKKRTTELAKQRETQFNSTYAGVLQAVHLTPERLANLSTAGASNIRQIDINQSLINKSSIRKLSLPSNNSPILPERYKAKSSIRQRLERSFRQTVFGEESQSNRPLGQPLNQTERTPTVPVDLLNRDNILESTSTDTVGVFSVRDSSELSGIGPLNLSGIDHPEEERVKSPESTDINESNVFGLPIRNLQQHIDSLLEEAEGNVDDIDSLDETPTHDDTLAEASYSNRYQFLTALHRRVKARKTLNLQKIPINFEQPDERPVDLPIANMARWASGEIEQGRVKIPAMLKWRESGTPPMSLPIALSNYAIGEPTEPDDNIIIAKRDRLLKFIGKEIDKLTQQMEAEQDVNKIFVILQKIFKFSWSEISFTINIRNKPDIQDETIITDQALRNNKYKDWHEPIEEAQEFLKTLGYREVVFNDTLDVPNRTVALPIKQNAILQGSFGLQSRTPDEDKSEEPNMTGALVDVFKEFKEMQVDRGTKESIPVYKGGAAKWFSFWHQFQVLVDQNPKLATITKFARLKKYLDGPPFNLIDKQFLFADTEYEAAKAELKRQYGNERKIAHELLTEVIKLPNIKEGDIQTYRNFTNNATQTVKYISTYIPNELKRNKYLLGSLLQKFPWRDQLMWQDFLDSKMEKANTPEEKEAIEDSVITLFVEWGTKFTTKQEALTISNMGVNDLVKQTSTSTAGKSFKRGSFRGRYGGGTYKPPKDELNFSAQTENSSSQNKDNSTTSSRGRGRGRGQNTRGRGSGRGRGRGNSTPNQNPQSGPGKTQGGVGSQTNPTRNPQTGRGKATVYPQDYRNRICIICQQTMHKSRDCPVTQHYECHEIFNIVKRMDVCTNCYLYGHSAISCNLPPSCKVCQGYHTTHIHGIYEKISDANQSKKKPTQSSPQNKPPVHQSFHTTLMDFEEEEDNAILPSVCAQAEGHDNIIDIRLLLDTGSSCNFISVSSANKIKHIVIEECSAIVVKTLHGNKTKFLKKISFNLCVRENSNWKLSVHAFVIPQVTTLSPITITSKQLEKYCDSSVVFNERYPRVNPVEVDLLLGVIDTVKILGNKQISVAKNLCLMSTRWGYILMGSDRLECIDKNLPLRDSHFTKTEVLTKQLEEMWKLEQLPQDNDITGLSKEEVQAVEMINKVCTYNPEIRKFETKLLFKSAPKFQNNYRQAKARLDNLVRKLRKDEPTAKGYNDVINEYLSAGIIEQVFDENASDPNRTDLFYLPHRIIVDSTRLTTKYRVVYDGSAKCPDGKSLNSCIMCGPKLQQDILAILIRFRSSFYILLSDISRMFLNCNIKGKDKDFLRFLYKDPTHKNPDLKIFRFTTLVFGLSDSPFQVLTCLQKLVQRKLQDPNITEYERKACDIIKRDMYIDDCTFSCSNEKEAIEIRKALTNILAEGSFHIRKWISNSPKILETIPEQEKAPLTNMKTLFGHNQEISDVTSQLGYRYDPDKDIFLFDTYTDLLNKNRDDMRSVASIMASLYDPLGIISPFILQARQLLKKLFQLKLGWDDSLPEALIDEWRLWCSQLKYLNSFTFPRYVPTNETTEYLIAGDASISGFACCAYARTYFKEEDKYEVTLLMAKARVSPVHELTVPRLELKAAHLAADMGHYIHTEMGVDKSKISLYSDSEVVLFWLHKNLNISFPLLVIGF